LISDFTFFIQEKKNDVTLIMVYIVGL